ncbi:MAG: hypothetical protein JWO38_5909 [Gemmataceae bacterium]|nr:hypothetical protein [Gemmataceae bacterium]
MTPSELRTLGEQIFGPVWKTKLAKALPVSTRSIRFWLAGDRKMRPVIAERIRAMAAEAGKRP